MNKTYIWLISVFAIISATIYIGIAVILYWLNFHKLGLSTEQEEWAQFGDFLGGVTNPVLSLLTLLLTGYIAFIVSVSEVEKEDRERRRYLFDLQFAEYKSLNAILDSLNKMTDANLREGASILFFAQIGISSFVTSNNFLFPFINDFKPGSIYRTLADKIGEVRSIYINQMNGNLIRQRRGITTSDNPTMNKELEGALRECFAAAAAVHNEMQTFLRSQLDQQVPR